MEKARDTVEVHVIRVALGALFEGVLLAQSSDVVWWSEGNVDGREAGLDDGLHERVGLGHDHLLLCLLLLHGLRHLLLLLWGRRGAVAVHGLPRAVRVHWLGHDGGRRGRESSERDVATPAWSGA